MQKQLKPRQIFAARLWSFLNYRTTLRLTWLELVSLVLAGLMLAWDALRDWSGIGLLFPVALYLLLFGFYRELPVPVGWVRGLYEGLYRPLHVRPAPSKKFRVLLAVFAALAFIGLMWLVDLRLALLAALTVLVVCALLWAIDARETANGSRNLHTVAGRLPLSRVMENGDVVGQDGAVSRAAILTMGRTGYKPALKAVDIAETLTKFLAYLAQHEEGGQPIRLFWVTDYHLGQLDLPEAGRLPPDYVEELRRMADQGGRKARVIISGIIYPPALEERIRDWLAQVDLGLAPLGAYSTESLLRMLFRGESFLGQIQQEALAKNGHRKELRFRGYLPAELQFGGQLKTGQNVLNVLQVNSPFAEAREPLMRALKAVDGLLTVTVTPLPRDRSATEIRGQLLAARVPGLGRPREAAHLRETLDQLEDRRSLEYLFDTRAFFVTWGPNEEQAQLNQNLAASYLTGLNLTPVSGRALENSLTGWLPLLPAAPAADRATRFMDWLAAPRSLPGQKLLTTQAISALAREEGSDVHLADARGRILLGRSVMPGKEGLRYADFRSDTGPVLFVSDQGGGKTSSMIIWFLLRLQILNYKIIAVNLKYSNRMEAAVDKVDGIVLHPEENLLRFEETARAALFSEATVLYQPVKGTRPYAIADDPCLRIFMKILYEEWLPRRDKPAALVIDEIHRLMPKDRPLSENAAETANYVAEAFKDWAERKLVIAAATQTLRDLLGSNLGVALQKFRTVAYFQVGPEDRDQLIEKGYEPALVELIVGSRRRPRGYCVLVMPDGFYTTMKVLVTPEELEVIQRLDVDETSDVTPMLNFG